MPPDYAAAVASCALFDRSAAAKLLLTGPDAPKFLHNIATNAIVDLPLGGGCETYFCDSRAKALFVAWVYHVMHGTEHALWVETTPGKGGDLLKHLDRFLFSEAVEMTDITGQFAQFHLAGPTAKAVLEQALAESVPALAEFAHCERTLGSTTPLGVRSRRLLGVPGYDLVTPAERSDGLRRMLVAAGAVAGGPDAFEVLRVEAGTPVAGIDFDEKRFALEIARASRAVAYSKGCFPGQEPMVMARDRAGRVNRSMVTLRLSASLPVGAKLARDGAEVGFVTSVAESPRFGAVALGYARHDCVEPGTELTAGGVTALVGAVA